MDNLLQPVRSAGLFRAGYGAVGRSVAVLCGDYMRSSLVSRMHSLTFTALKVQVL